MVEGLGGELILVEFVGYSHGEGLAHQNLGGGEGGGVGRKEVVRSAANC